MSYQKFWQIQIRVGYHQSLIFLRVDTEKFLSRAKNIGLSSNSSDFLDYLQSTRCEDLMISNKLKIHIDTGNIYYDNNESIYDFFQLQEEETKKFIEHEFVYDDTYQQYYDEFLLKINQHDDDNGAGPFYLLLPSV